MLSLGAAHLLDGDGGCKEREEAITCCQTSVDRAYGRGSPAKRDLRQDDTSSHNAPAQATSDADTPLDVRLDYEEDDSAPEDHLERVDDGIGFQASPPLEVLEMLGEDLVADQED